MDQVDPRALDQRSQFAGPAIPVDDSWEKPIQSMLPAMLLDRPNIFFVDKTHTDRWGSDERRQIIEAANLKESQSEKDVDLFEEEVLSTTSRWTRLSDCELLQRSGKETSGKAWSVNVPTVPFLLWALLFLRVCGDGMQRGNSSC